MPPQQQHWMGKAREGGLTPTPRGGGCQSQHLAFCPYPLGTSSSTPAGSCFCLTAFLSPPTCHSFPAKQDSQANAGAESRKLGALGKGQEPQVGKWSLLSPKLSGTEQCPTVSLPDPGFVRAERVPLSPFGGGGRGRQSRSSLPGPWQRLP